MSEDIIDLTGLEKEVNKLIEQRLVAKIMFKGTTPWWGGDYEGNTSDHVDEDEIIGRVRWFLRTVYNRFCATNLNSYVEAEEFVSRLFGSTSSRSLYTIKTSNTKPTASDYIDLPRIEDLPRIKLATQGKKMKKLLLLNIQNLTVEIYRNRMTAFDEIIVAAVILTLVFLGVGRGANRGFGRFIPYNCPKIANSICNKVLQGDVIGAFNEFYNSFRRATNCNRMNSWDKSAVPLAPLTTASTDSIRVIQCNTNPCNQMKAIQNAVMKVTFKTTAFKARATDEGGYIHTFIFGLPRHSVVTFKTSVSGYKLNINPPNLSSIIRRYFQLNPIIKIDDNTRAKYKPLRGITGYYALRNNDIVDIRRQSMHILSPFKDKIVILPFLSLLDHEMIITDIVHIRVHTNANIATKRQTPRQTQPRTSSNANIATRLDVIVRPVTDLMEGTGLNPHESQLASRNSALAFENLKQLIENYTNALQYMIRCS
jgi:CRISPR type III-B/RAMP module RAMP protein Cmr1